MKKRLILIILVFASLGYAVYTYWPVVSPYFAREKAAPAPTLEELKKKYAAQKVTPTTATTLKKAPAAKIEKKEEKKAVPAKMVSKLIDPFALRIAVKTRQEVEAARKAREEAKKEEKPVKPVGPKLEGIWVGSGLRAAFISGQVVTEGGTIMGWRVTRIEHTQVVLRKGRSTKVLKLGGEVK